MAKGSTMVLPPKAAARVPDSKSSAITMPGPDGCDRCTWLSMPPGSTSLPVASTISFASPRSAPSAAIFPSVMPISQENVSAAVAIVPPRMIVSKVMRSSLSVAHYRGVGGLGNAETVAEPQPRDVSDLGQRSGEFRVRIVADTLLERREDRLRRLVQPNAHNERK